jgi:peptidoglycan/xylan/chitin deacetylase (PgdA/CDA1 family)
MSSANGPCGEATTTYPRPRALLSFDCEEFDLPAEFGRSIALDRQIALGAEGVDRTLALLSERGVGATMFTTGALARARPSLVRRMVAAGHEVASHALSHSSFRAADLRTSRSILEDISATPVVGFRRPRMRSTAAGEILEAGYLYDSSIHPTWIPGRYNGLRQPRCAYWEDGLLRVPLSVTPTIRWPVFWLAFKNLPLCVTQAAVQRILSHDGYCALCFHPWETVDLGDTDIPGYIRRVHGDAMVERLRKFLGWLATRAEIVTYREFLATRAVCPPPETVQ